MDKNAIKTYAVWARNELRDRVSKKLDQYEITAGADANADSVRGRLLTKDEKAQRAKAIEKVKEKGIEQVIEEVAYTWFNRFSALRFMEVNNYLPTRIRVFTDENNEFKPQILSEAIHMELDGLNMEKVYDLKEKNNNDELFKYLIITQCNALSKILPDMFQKIADYTELLFPDNLLREGSVIEQMIKKIPQEDFNAESGNGQVEILGWLYQYYISEKHEEVVDPLHGKIVKKEDVPAATQLFTTDWVVRYLIDNSVGRYWIERNPGSTLADKLTYFVKPKDGTIKTVNEKITPQDVTTFDPCVGSGHFLIYAFDVLMKIYVEYGYSERDAAAEIVKNNLFGLDIDGRASQLAYFSVMMKARQYDRRFFSRGIQPHIFEITESNSADRTSIEHFYGSDVALKNDVEDLLDTLKDAKEYGSILQMPAVDFGRINERFAQLDGEISMYNTYLLGDFQAMIRPAEIMSGKYAVVATNPPYLNKYDAKLKKYILDLYKDYSGDLFSVFMYKNFDYCKKDGYLGFMTPFVWMFIKTYEKLRSFVLLNKSIATLIQMEYSAFEDATVPICSFVLKNGLERGKGIYIKLSDFKGGMEVQKEKTVDAIKATDCNYLYSVSSEMLKMIDGYPISFWAPENVFKLFDEAPKVGDSFEVRNGITTADNNLFLRLWHEIDYSKFNIKWFPCNKGGSYRKWYGNQEFVVDWENDGYNLKHFVDNKGKLRPTLRSIEFNFQKAITMSRITSSKNSFRWIGEGFITEGAANNIYFDDENAAKLLLGFLNSTTAEFIIGLYNQTINLMPDEVRRIPFLMPNYELIELVDELIDCEKDDWNREETSWDFQTHFLVSSSTHLLSAILSEKKKEHEKLENRVAEIETALNYTYAALYDVERIVACKIMSTDVTLRGISEEEAIRSLISYAVGCMFGRYSLDVPGLVYAGGTWDATKYTTFQPDKDAIIPICDDEYFEDDIVGRFVDFVKEVFGAETLEENLKFIADSLGGSGAPREVIRNYFLNGFYADHLKMYQKRPIYWLFDSGKKNGFKCLIYMHRYKPDTIARIRTDYVHEQQSRYRTAIAGLERQIADASTSERVRLNKRLSTLKDQAEETRKYEEKIHHLADQMISIDLDDGVKHNYEIFKDVLAKIK
mgnify:CR=1 FL=1